MGTASGSKYILCMYMDALGMLFKRAWGSMVFRLIGLVVKSLACPQGLGGILGF